MSVNGPAEITAAASRGTPERGLGILHTLALIGLVAGAVGSVGFMFGIGHRNPSRLLLLLFLIWDISPFVGAVIVDMVSKRWPAIPRATFYGVMIIFSLGSLALYGDVVLRPRPQPAFMFLVVPAGSWLLMIIVVPIAALVSGRLSRRSDDA
jgi:hypothetical protein